MYVIVSLGLHLYSYVCDIVSLGLHLYSYVCDSLPWISPIQLCMW